MIKVFDYLLSEFLSKNRGILNDIPARYYRGSKIYGINGTFKTFLMSN